VNKLFYGDNLAVLRNREQFPDRGVDLIYLDPPFNSVATYNVLFKGPAAEIDRGAEGGEASRRRAQGATLQEFAASYDRSISTMRRATRPA
jgi:hypothetical protein